MLYKHIRIVAGHGYMTSSNSKLTTHLSQALRSPVRVVDGQVDEVVYIGHSE